MSSPRACILCATGSYSALPEQSACKQCPGVQDTINTGSSSQLACIAPGFASIVGPHTYYEIAVFAAAALICYAVSSFLDRKYLGQQHLPIFFAVMSFLDLAMSMWFLFDTRPYLQVLAKRNNLFTAAPFSIGILISVGLLVILGWLVSWILPLCLMFSNLDFAFFRLYSGTLALRWFRDVSTRAWPWWIACTS